MPSNICYVKSGFEIKAKIIAVEALGSLLFYYRSDLEYIKTFQRCKLDRGDHLTYFRKTVLPKFLAEYRIARGVKKGKRKDLFQAVLAHAKTAYANDVDCLAKKLRKGGVTQKDKTMVSLASKILFLNSPWEILPYDRLVRIAIGYSGRSYSGYIEAVEKSKDRILKLYHGLPKSILGYLQLIEREVAPDVPHLDRIREARFIDKVLWTLGRNGMEFKDIDR